MKQTEIDLLVRQPGSYRLTVRYSPYFAAEGACITKTEKGWTQLDVRRAGRVRLGFSITPGRALAALAGSKSSCDKN
jgi:hypothetical protein